jgi:REP element-mobilizing transposase RayT
MARLPRIDVPNVPHHVVQRGNNRQAIFFTTTITTPTWDTCVKP